MTDQTTIRLPDGTTHIVRIGTDEQEAYIRDIEARGGPMTREEIDADTSLIGPTGPAR